MKNRTLIRRWGLPAAAACLLAAPFVLTSAGAQTPAAPAQAGAAPAQGACQSDMGGITLPPGFCATVFADKIGHSRHLTVAPNGVVYANTWSGTYYHNDTPHPGGFIVAMKDTKGDGHADQIVRFGETQASGGHGGTGIAYFNGHLYVEINDRIVRYALSDSDVAPKGAPEVILSGLPLSGDHPMHPFAIDKSGNMYVDLGTPSNSCQEENRIPNSLGRTPCPELTTRGGTWRYDANKLDQHFSPAERFVTGLRNGEGISFDSSGRIFATQHGRDQLGENFPKLFTLQQSHELPAEELVEEQQGRDFGWPECYFDGFQKQLMLAPEYGGDGKKAGICAQKTAPVAFFPAHWAPNDMLIYEGSQFPAAYKDGAFIAFHGSWNRAPAPQGGYNIVFQPMKDGKASGPFVVWADGFAGAHKDPGRAAHRPTGLAVAPDGSLYIADDQNGRIWHVTYTGSSSTEVAAAPPPPASTSSAENLQPPEGTHPNAGNVLADLPVPPGATKAQVALGDKVFHGQGGATCEGCHGTDGKGTPVGADLTAGKWLWSDGSLKGITQTITNGVTHPKEHTGVMPPEGGTQLTPANLQAVAAYVWALGHQTQH